MKTIKAIWDKFGNWVLIGIIVAIAVLQPQINRNIITFKEAIAAGTADYSLGLNGTTNAANITTALNALPSQGGLFHFKVGSYNVTANASGNITRAFGNMTIEGEGKGTFFTGNGTFVPGGSNWVFSNLAFNFLSTQLPQNATWDRIYTLDYPNGVNKDINGVYIGLNMSGNITPTVNATHNLGSSLKKWLTGWFVNLVTDTLNATQVNGVTGNFSTLNAPTGRGATYVIAASDSPSSAKAQADYIVTGNLNTTIAPLLANNISIIIMQGNYNSATIDTGVFNNIDIGGIAKSSVKITLVSGTNNDLFVSGNNDAYTPNVYFHDFTLLGNSAGNSAGIGIHFKAVENGWVKNTEIRGFTNDGIRSEGSASRNSVYTTVKGNYIVANLGSGVYLLNQSYGAIIEGNTFGGNGVHGSSDAGVRTNGNSEHTIQGNLFDEGNTGIFSFNTATVTVNGNMFLNQDREAIKAYTGSVAEKTWTITGNTILNAGQNATDSFAVIAGDFVASTISLNTFTSSGLNRVFADIDELSPAANNTIIGNIFSNNLTAGFTGIRAVSPLTIVRANTRHITENSGNVTLAANTSIVTVTHGLALTPTWVGLTSTSNLTQWLYVSGVNATSFNITSSVNVTTNTTLYWRATVGAGN